MDGFTAKGAFPEEIRVEPLPDGVRYVLPIRDWPGRWSAWIVLSMGLLLVAVAVGLVTFINAAMTSLPGMILLLVSLGMVATGIVLCIWAHNTLIGRAEIELHSEELLGIEVTGRLRWRRRRTLQNLNRIVVIHQWHQAASSGMYANELSRVAYRLVVEYEGGERQKLITWYSRELLEPVARDLTNRLKLAEPVGIQGPAEDEVPFEGSADPPEDSAMVISRTPDGMSVQVPPLNILRSKEGRSLTGLLGGGAAGAGAGMFTMIMFTGIGGMWWMWIVFSIPALVGGVFVAAGLLGERETFIDVVDDTLLISVRKLRGVTQHRFERRELQTIRAGESLLEVNDEHLPQLHIVPRSGDTIRLLTGRNVNELAWLAHNLREQLGLEYEPENQDEDEDDNAGEA